MATDRGDVSERFLRWLAGAAVLLTFATPLTSLSLSAELEPLLPVLAGTLLYLPLEGWLIIGAARGERSPGRWWVLAGLTAVIVGGTAVNGLPWLPAYGALALAVLIVLPAPWSAAAFVALVGAQFPLASAVGDAGFGLLSALLVSKALAIFALLRLMSAVRELARTRARLAAEAVMQERLRIDGELRRTVGSDLERIAADGDRLASVTDAADLEPALRALAGRSRAALARARGLTGAYQRPSLRGELDTAVSLLRAAGIQVRLHVPADLPETLADIRTQLRVEVASLLRERSAGWCEITLTVRSARVELDVRSGAVPSAVEVGA